MENQANQGQPQGYPGQAGTGQSAMAQPPVQYVSPKSATAAGLLGIFLGAVGAHNWYLGEKKKGIAHLCLLGGGILLMIIAAIVLGSVVGSSVSNGGYSSYYYSNGYVYTTGDLDVSGGLAALMVVLFFLGWAALIGNGIWGIVEGIIILAQGDAGLARKGIPVNVPVVYQPYPGQASMAGGGAAADASAGETLDVDVSAGAPAATKEMTSAKKAAGKK